MSVFYLSGQIQPLDATLMTAVISDRAARTSASAGQSLPLRSVKAFRQAFTYMKQIMREDHPKELWNPPHRLSDFIYLETSLNYQSLQLAYVWSAETPSLLCSTSPTRAGIHTSAIHSAACQYSAATQFRCKWNGSFDAQSYCSAEIDRGMFGPCNHTDVYNFLQSNSANRILTRTSSMVNA